MKEIESKEGDSTHYIATIILVLFVFLGCCVIIGTYLHDRRKNRDKQKFTQVNNGQSIEHYGMQNPISEETNENTIELDSAGRSIKTRS